MDTTILEVRVAQVMAMTTGMLTVMMIMDTDTVAAEDTITATATVMDTDTAMLMARRKDSVRRSSRSCSTEKQPEQTTTRLTPTTPTTSTIAIMDTVTAMTTTLMLRTQTP